MKVVLLLVLISTISQYGISDVPVKRLLTVYYESKCPDSRKFIEEQLGPAVYLLQGHLDLQMVPFGKAHSIHNGFECQHGPSECLGNLVQDCALYHMQGRPDTEKVAYVTCEMTSLAGTNGNFMCIELAKQSVEKVRQCVHSSEGFELQLNSERLTKRISPQFVPTVTFNDEFNQHFQDQAQEDLIGALCGKMKEYPPCAGYYNEQALDGSF